LSIEVITYLMFGALVLFLALGLPIAFVTGGLAVIFTLLLLSPGALYNIPLHVFSLMGRYELVAVPMFVFMAQMLERSGISDELFKTVHVWLGSVRGSLAIAAILVSTIMAAMVGVVAAAVVTMAVIALPVMLKNRYDKGIALGSIAAGGSLGILIPPSILFVFYGTVAGESIGKLFIGGIGPGLLLSFLYCAYVAIRSYLQPSLCPALPKEERTFTLGQKIVALRGIILPVILVVTVLGSIYFGIAAITEAAGVGGLGAIVCAAIGRKLTWKNFKEASYATIRATAMASWILFGASAFVAVYQAVGGTHFVTEVVLALPLSRWGILLLFQAILIILGCFIDAFGIILLTVPIFLPIISELGFDTLWFGILFNINMQIALLTPPFGAALFYLQGMAPPSITTGDIYRSVRVFILLQVLGLGLCIIFPQIALWLPSTMIK